MPRRPLFRLLSALGLAGHLIGASCQPITQAVEVRRQGLPTQFQLGGRQTRFIEQWQVPPAQYKQNPPMDQHQQTKSIRRHRENVFMFGLLQ